MPAPQAQTQLEQTSAVLGEYMLKGWTLTDLHCDQCRITPLMREPTSQASREGRDPIQFCALCDRTPAPAPASAAAATATPTASSSHSSHTLAAPSPSTSTTPTLGRVRSPSPSFNVETGAVSSPADEAAQKISSLLLQGYSLLGVNCPNPKGKSSCRSIPLVGLPRQKDGKKDNRRMCVGCGSTFVEDPVTRVLKLVDGRTQAAGESGSPRGDSGKGKGREIQPDSPRTRRRKELYGLSEAVSSIPGDEPARAVDTPSVPDVTTGESSQDMSESKADSAALAETDLAASSNLSPALRKTSDSLALTLDRLAVSLERHTLGTDKDAEARYFVDVKLHTDAMRDVLDVIAKVEQYRSSR